MASPAHDGSEIRVMSLIESVRRRPGMYIGDVDAGGMHRLLWGLVGNAIEGHLATGRDGYIRIQLDDERVIVEDNGPGIDPSLLTRIGEPFQTTKADTGGMGLGLYVSSVLAERMGGSLAVENIGEAQGTRVILTIRAARGS